MYASYRLARSGAAGSKTGTGWLPPLPDLRDYTTDEPKIRDIADKLGVKRGKRRKAAKFVDLRPWCSPVENQGVIGSCTAHAAVGIVEYFQRRAFGKHIEGSRLFVYKTTRNLMQVSGDQGAWLRNTMGALALCGVPDEKYWPYTDDAEGFDVEPPSFVYSVADNYEAVKYFRHDPAGAQKPGAEVLASVKTWLGAGVPSMFGFWGFPSSEAGDIPGGVPYPGPDESAIWGHAVVAVGYDDARKVGNTITGEVETGALLIRNSWGREWGDEGHGWLPYRYVVDGLATDFWSLLSMDWVDTEAFA